MGASVFVAVILFVFLGTLRPTIIALTAIPVSIFVTALVFRYFGLSINTMTLGGLAIAIGGLVDDAVVDVENVLRRPQAGAPKARSGAHAHAGGGQARLDGGAIGILYATAIIVLVSCPCLRCLASRGAVRAPGIAFIVSTLASPPAPGQGDAGSGLPPVATMKSLDDDDTRVLARPESARYRKALQAVLMAPKSALMAGGVAAVLPAAGGAFLRHHLLPPFNEGTLLIGLLEPG